MRNVINQMMQHFGTITATRINSTIRSNFVSDWKHRMTLASFLDSIILCIQPKEVELTSVSDSDDLQDNWRTIWSDPDVFMLTLYVDTGLGGSSCGTLASSWLRFVAAVAYLHCGGRYPVCFVSFWRKRSSKWIAQCLPVRRYYR